MKLFFTANGDHHNKSQLDTMQRSKNQDELSLSGYVHITAAVSTAQGTSQKTY